MRRTKKQWGTVSADGGRWTMHYAKDPRQSASSITCTGYGPDVFEGFTGPVLRFDKSPIQATMASISKMRSVVNHDYIWPGESPLTVKEYIDDRQSLGVTVEQWKDGKPS